MAATDYSTLLAGSGQPNRSGLLTALEKRGAYVIASAENPQALTPGNVLTLIFNGVVFWYDSADSTTAHDGTTCIVTADGKRFKADQFRGRNAKIVPVLDKDLTAPPGSPAVGDTYIVAAGGSGAWAAKDKYFASWTARGWVFQAPNAYDIAIAADEVQFYYYSAGGAWTSGLPALTIADASISFAKLKYFNLGIVAVENQTTNTPPVSPADGVAYIVGGSPTGAWVGHSLAVAIFEGSAWVYYTPYEGAEVYDKSLDVFYKFNGATWETPALNAWTLIEKRVITVAVATADFTGLGAYRAIRILGMNLIPQSNQVSLRFKISSDNGATYLGGSYAGNSLTGSDPDAVKSRNTANNGFEMRSASNVATDFMGNAGGDGGVDFDAILTSFNVAQKTKFRALLEFGADSGGLQTAVIQGWHGAQTAMNALQLLFSSGNINSGVILLEGLT